MSDILKSFVDTANARADANTFKAGAKVMAEHFDAETARLMAQLRDCEMSLSIFDEGRSSEYWMRHSVQPSNE